MVGARQVMAIQERNELKPLTVPLPNQPLTVAPTTAEDKGQAWRKLTHSSLSLSLSLSPFLCLLPPLVCQTAKLSYYSCPRCLYHLQTGCGCYAFPLPWNCAITARNLKLKISCSHIGEFAVIKGVGCTLSSEINGYILLAEISSHGGTSCSI